MNGPRIGDGPAQTSQEGVPIAWVIGTCGWVSGNIVDKSPRREVKKTDDGKGSGTEVNTFEAHQDFVIMICESSETRESLMTGVLIVRIDGKIVYDMRPASNFGAENAKFLDNHTFYNGNESQLPDPTAETFPHNGVGNTPYYRGVYTMVARDINLTQYGDRIPAYEFVMVGAGETEVVTTELPLIPQLAGYRDDPWPLVDEESDYIFTGTRGFEPTFAADTIAEILEHYRTKYGSGAPTAQYYGYSAFSTFDSGLATFAYTSVLDQPTVVDNQYLTLVYNDYLPDHFADFDDLGDSFTGACAYLPDGPDTWAGRNGVWVYKEPIVGPPTGPDESWYNCAGLVSRTRGRYPIYILVERREVAPVVPSGDPCLLGVPVVLPDAPGMQIDCAGVVSPLPTYSFEAGTWRQLALADVNLVDDRLQFTRDAEGPILPSTDPNYSNSAFWTSAYNAAVAAGDLPPGWTYTVEYPITVSTALIATTTVDFVQTDTVGVDTAILRISKRGGLEDSDSDVSEMTDQLLGYMITQQYNGADCIRPLMTGFTAYGTEYDAQIHYHKHGEVIEVIVDPEDFIEGSETDKDTREQAIEYPRLISVTAIDPTQDYTARPQVERRITPDVRAIGEQQMQVPIVMEPDAQRQLASIAMKVAWARAQGSREFSLPYVQADEYLHLVAGKPLALDGKRYIASEYGLEDGEIKIKALYDRQSAYTSNVTATPALPPTPPPSNIGGVTLSAFLNAGVFRDRDDTLGIYVAVAGILDAWPGALLQWKLDTDSDWTTAIPSMTQASTMGYLTAPLPLAPASGDDVTNTLSVSVHGGELNSVTRFQYLNEANPYAIITNTTTGECELGQFQDADETAPGEYDLTTLVRGGLNTTPSAHAQGARFVFLDSVYFLPIPIAWLGRTINLRPVTLGTIPDNNASYSIVFDPAVSQTEWQVGSLDYTIDGTVVSLTITPRQRLGNDVTPIASTNFIGYQIEVEDDVDQFSAFTSTTPTVSIDISTLITPVTVTVSALNRITGPGPSMSIVIP